MSLTKSSKKYSIGKGIFGATPEHHDSRNLGNEDDNDEDGAT